MVPSRSSSAWHSIITGRKACADQAHRKAVLLGCIELSAFIRVISGKKYETQTRRLSKSVHGPALRHRRDDAAPMDRSRGDAERRWDGVLHRFPRPAR